MSIAMHTTRGRKGRHGPPSPATPVHSPPTPVSPLPKIKLNIKHKSYSRPASASSHSRASRSTTHHRDVFSEDSSSDLTPADDDDDDQDGGEDDENDVFPQLVPRKAKKRESLPLVQAPPAKDKGKGKASSPVAPKKDTPNHPSSSRPSAHGPGGRDRKRHIKLGEVARRRARDDKFGFGGGDRFSSATPAHSRIPHPGGIESDSTSSYGDDESEREHTLSLLGDETEDETMGRLHQAFAGQEIEDLAYGAGHPQDSIEDDAAWWHGTGPDDDDDENEDDEFIAQLTGSDIEALQSQSSVHASSDDPMSDTTSSEEDDVVDEFGFPATFGSNEAPGSDQPLVLMENWDGQFVLVQPRNDRTNRRHRGSGSTSGSRTAGSVGESTSLSAGENNLLVDPDADSDDSSSWSGVDDDNDGGDTTDSMCEDDMPVLNSPALDQIVAQQMANGFELDLDFIASLPLPVSLIETATALIESSKELQVAEGAEASNPSIVVTDPSGEGVSPAVSTASPASSAPTPMEVPMEVPLDVAAVSLAQPAAPLTPTPASVAPAPVMGVFSVSDEPCAHAVIDGSKTTTKSPFTRRRRTTNPSDAGSVVGGNKRRSSRDPFSPVVKKTRYSSIPGHPRYIAARRAAESLVDPLDRETTPSEEEAFSLDDMLDASMLPMNELDSSATPQSPELRHLFRFDKVPVSMYMRRNFSSASRNRTSSPGPSQTFAFSPIQKDNGLTGTLAGPLAHPASRMLISPLLKPVKAPESEAMSRKDRRKARKGRMETLQI